MAEENENNTVANNEEEYSLFEETLEQPKIDTPTDEFGGEIIFDGNSKAISRVTSIDNYPDELKIDLQPEQFGNIALLNFKDGSTSGKGLINNAISSYLFNALSIIPNHYIKANGNYMLVVAGKVLPIKVIFRFKADGTFSERYGIKGNPSVMKIRDGIIEPLIEFCLKSSELGDPIIGEGAIIQIGLIDKETLDVVKNMAIQTANILKSIFSLNGIDLIDGELEFIKNMNGTILLANELSPDNLRLIDFNTGKNLSKDIRSDDSEFINKYRLILDRLKAGSETNITIK